MFNRNRISTMAYGTGTLVSGGMFAAISVCGRGVGR